MVRGLGDHLAPPLNGQGTKQSPGLQANTAFNPLLDKRMCMRLNNEHKCILPPPPPPPNDHTDTFTLIPRQHLFIGQRTSSVQPVPQTAPGVTRRCGSQGASQTSLITNGEEERRGESEEWRGE